jgi:hypothetical protein
LRVNPTKPKRLVFTASSAKPPPKGTPVPRTVGEAKKSEFWEGFKGAIERELETLEKNGTWELVERKSLPWGTNILRSKFVFDLKYGPTGEFVKFKARMVAMGYTQVEGVDYFETFAGVFTPKSFRIFLALWNYFPVHRFRRQSTCTRFLVLKRKGQKEKFYDSKKLFMEPNRLVRGSCFLEKFFLTWEPREI